MEKRPSEGTIIFLVGAVQFINILDFMMVMPLGPDFSAALGIPLSHLGYIGGAYTAAASISGLAGVFFLDAFDRRQALAVAMGGLVLGTLAGAAATGFATLLAARVVAGMFGGPATSLAFSIISDVIPPERRGKAMGAVMGAFAAASVLGVPAGLELAARGGWRLPFLAVGTLGAIITTLVRASLPSLRMHLDNRMEPRPLRELLRGQVALSLSLTSLVMMSTFVLVPNISGYVLGNLHYPRRHLALLYFFGGIVSFFATRIAGGLNDKLSATQVGGLGVALNVIVVYTGFAIEPPMVPVAATFMFFMLSMSFRNVSYNTLTSKVPRLQERARFQSVQSAVQHMSAAVGAFLSARILSEGPNDTLRGMGIVAWVSIGLSLAIPLALFAVDRSVRAKGAA